MTDSNFIQIGNQLCRVQTLRQWLNERITQLRKAIRQAEDETHESNLQGRLVELMIVREKLNDRRIQEIG